MMSGLNLIHNCAYFMYNYHFYTFSIHSALQQPAVFCELQVILYNNILCNSTIIFILNGQYFTFSQSCINIQKFIDNQTKKCKIL